MTKFRWTRELLAERKEALRPTKLVDAGGDEYETMAQYWKRTASSRAARARQAAAAAQNLQALARPLKPPARRAT